MDTFLALANTATGPLALCSVIERCLKHKDVFAFAELLELDSVQAVCISLFIFLIFCRV